ncbi:hypothetical protein E2542_SST07817 [Spatholobus suberectus]|nr:hypothetical protein E2542_SST07817 [Spatholobus suberectus]
MFQVDALDGTTSKMMLNEDLADANDIAVRNNSIATVVSLMKELWLVKSINSWAKGVVYDKVEIDASRFPSSVVVGDKDKVYALYRHLDEGRVENLGRESFGIAEGYLLVVQSSTRKVFKVDVADSTMRNVLLNKDLVGADDIVVKNDGAAAVVSPMKELWLVKSIDNWAEGAVYDKVEIDVR